MQILLPGINIACSRRSDSRAREKNSRRVKKKQNRGPPPPVFPVYNLTRSPTYRRALLSEHLEQARINIVRRKSLKNMMNNVESMLSLKRGKAL